MPRKPNDSKLIAAAAETVRIARAYDALGGSSPADDDARGAVGDKLAAALERSLARPARTLAGVRCQAEAVLAWWAGDTPPDPAAVFVLQALVDVLQADTATTGSGKLAI